jgi:hypothetical protein
MRVTTLPGSIQYKGWTKIIVDSDHNIRQKVGKGWFSCDVCRERNWPFQFPGHCRAGRGEVEVVPVAMTVPAPSSYSVCAQPKGVFPWLSYS